MEIIKVENLNKFFYDPTELHVLRNINFSVKSHTLTTVTGKSGSGKSTLLYLLSTMDTGYEGNIIINGENISNRSNQWLSNFRNQNIGFVFQFHYLLPEFTALQNVMLPALKLRAFPKFMIKERAIELMDILEIGNIINKKSSLLSGGQQQRVAIARALINTPPLLITDEPTGNLDSLNTDLVIRLFKKLTIEKKTTILAVTHDVDFAKKSDKNIHIKDGVIDI